LGWEGRHNGCLCYQDARWGVAYQQSKALWIHGVYRHQILCNTRPEPKIVCNRQKSSKFTFGLSTIYDRRNQILDVDATQRRTSPTINVP